MLRKQDEGERVGRRYPTQRTRRQRAEVAPEQTARLAGLHYVSDAQPGIQRRRVGKRFRYTMPDGAPLRDPRDLRRIEALGIPPAWTDVWISPNPRGHLQATGHDAKGRKQYRYHAQWRAARDETKFERMVAFGEALPRIRAQTTVDLEQPGMARERILATVVRLLDETCIRIGNEEYARENASFGLTTLQNEHATVKGQTLHLHFRGKSGKDHRISVRDPKVARIVKRCQDLPGHELFHYRGKDGALLAIDSADVNAYIKRIAGDDFTAKDFRTWAGTVVTATALRNWPIPASEAQAKKQVGEAIKMAALRLGNTPAICRKCYVHPGVIGAYMAGAFVQAAMDHAAHTEEPAATGAAMEPAMVVASAVPDDRLQPEERATLALLRRMKRQGSDNRRESRAS